MNNNYDVICKCMAAEDICLFAKIDGSMYVSKKKGKYDGPTLRNAVSNGFNGMAITKIMQEYPEQMEMWVSWLLKEDRQY